MYVPSRVDTQGSWRQALLAFLQWIDCTVGLSLLPLLAQPFKMRCRIGLWGKVMQVELSLDGRLLVNSYDILCPWYLGRGTKYFDTWAAFASRVRTKRINGGCKSYGLIINVRRPLLVGNCGLFVADGRTGMQRFRVWVGMCGQGEGDGDGDGEFPNSEVCWLLFIAAFCSGESSERDTCEKLVSAKRWWFSFVSSYIRTRTRARGLATRDWAVGSGQWAPRYVHLIPHLEHLFQGRLAGWSIARLACMDNYHQVPYLRLNISNGSQ